MYLIHRVQASAAQPPLLPWQIRTGPERLILIFAACSAVVGSGLLLSLRIGAAGWPCVWKSVCGIPCAGCGGTRAVSLLLCGAWEQALALNPGAVAAVLGLALIALYASAVLVFRLQPLRPALLRAGGLRWFAASLLAANWIYLLVCARV